MNLPRLALPLSVDFGEFGIPESGLATPFDISETVLVGAGAVANGFLLALRHLATRGTMAIVDPKVVGEGNLAIGNKFRLARGQSLIARDDPLAVDRIEFTEIGNTAGFVGGNEGRA